MRADPVSRRMLHLGVLLAMLLSFLALPAAPVAQADFAPGNIVVLRVGDGSAALVNTGSPVFLDEYTVSGTLVQSIPMPTVANGSNRAFFLSGTASSEGLLTRSSDGRYLMLFGYASTAASSLSGTASATVNRVVARIGSDESIDTSTALTDAVDGNNPRSIASANGTDLWVTGGSGGIRYTTLGSTTSTQLSTTVTNLRQVSIANGQLYISTASGSAVRIGTVGTGLPTTAGQTITNLPGFASSGGGPFAFFFADLSAGVAGVDTLYVADDTALALTKYSLVGGNWTSNGTVGGDADDYRGVTGVVNGTTVTLFATRRGGTGATGGGEFVTLTDSSGYNGAFSGSPTLLATAASNTAFRGVALAPESGASDTAPSVANITPAAASVQPTDVDIEVVFSEPVTATVSSFAVVGSSSGPRSFLLSNTAQTTYSLALDDFLPGETVTLTVTAAQVSDVDSTDPPDTLTADVTRTFTIDAAPDAISTLPLPDATGVPVDQRVTINFNEPVSANGSPFAFTCNGAPVAFNLSNSPASTYTLTPTSNLPNSATCTVTTTGSLLSDVDAIDPPDTLASGTTSFSFTTAASSDSAPQVSSTNPTNGSVAVTTTTSITVTFDESVNFSASSFVITGSQSGGVAFTLETSSPATSVVLNPNADFQGGETVTVTVLAAQVSDTDAADPPDNPVANTVFSFEIAEPATACPAVPGGFPVSTISALQPNVIEPSSANNQQVTITGTVTADFQGGTQLGGFFVQQGNLDGDSATSDGIFVAATTPDVAVGDPVQVSGVVRDGTGSPAFRQTLINNATVTVCGTPQVIAPTVVALPVPAAVGGVSFLERYEGMLVVFTQTLTLAEYFNMNNFGEIVLTTERFQQPTSIIDPNDATPTGTSFSGNSNVAAITAQTDLIRRSRILIDDGSNVSFPSSVPYVAPGSVLRGGDTAQNVTGVLGYGFNNYRLQPTAAIAFTAVNPRPAAPANVGGDVQVASFNVLNYFTDIDPNGTSNLRGADSAAEFTRQATKIVEALRLLDADVVGLMEIQNNGATAVNDLVSRLNAATAPGTYAAIADPSGFGTVPGSTDAIKVALIYKPGVVTPVGTAQTINDTAFVNGRAPLAQTFRHNQTGELFSVVVNHFKSKGSCPSSGDPNADQGDGQSCWNLRRVEQAGALLNLIATLSAVDSDVLVIGDLNSYAQEDPIDRLRSGGLIDLLERFEPLNERYGYVFDGQLGYLDHALASASLNTLVSGATTWHINADEPDIMDYNDEIIDAGEPSGSERQLNPAGYYQPNQYRSSDHDPVLIGLNFNSPPTLTTVLTLGTALVNTPFTITYADLAAAANESDLDGDLIGFRIEGVLSGTLTKNGSAVVSGTTVLTAGEALVFTPNADGSAVPAFSIVATDGKAVSAQAVTVRVAVQRHLRLLGLVVRP